ncbi:LolA-like outer membrane lipoprotein chaperone [Sulfurospirillum deleyianum]|uniref:Outer membrane lipoprotein carrier protein LolA n=1 Tax=Sulfurospirillum deleyianum (strain ATCC 51133 / DSM 6946 / 5175) TaxID=525898 RepID=D1B2T9_SULD5|nr:LolA-like outer membrane lipoprotein chaperone [Sulfurospirillum deleyianum]ACZ12409.1 outer membrane lipoprotein carrier protein LolA [Sulfurospirillum deleyianum DSM 6946]
MRFALLLFTLASLLFAKIDSFKTIQSDFVQKVTNDQNKTIVYQGVFYATHDKKALWIYDKPVEKKIYFNETRVLIIEPELEQVIITTLENTPNIAQLLQEAKEISTNTYVTKFMETTYTILANTHGIEKVLYKDKLDNSVEILFSNQSTNLFLDDTLFKADIPKGYDIIRE